MQVLYYQSPIGLLKIDLDKESVHGCVFVEENTSPDDKLNHNIDIMGETEEQLKDYFEGKRLDFNLPLSLNGTPFQKNVWQAICSIPYGQTVDYGTLADMVDRPRAMRAVGAACARNPLAILIPCHRVIHRSGHVDGYTWGNDRKHWLLNFERKSLTDKT
ncbi:MAG: cysteine methyltransferase [Rickettsiales bacterium]|nr:cysteine methyltransferase [Rickettsiales bacterium]|tara:strand:- start:31448 stop:31927 length:480 start_codon:yes stop_codon:yes gene_type:complete